VNLLEAGSLSDNFDGPVQDTNTEPCTRQAKAKPREGGKRESQSKKEDRG
jgi:hypothetical protein